MPEINHIDNQRFDAKDVTKLFAYGTNSVRFWYSFPGRVFLKRSSSNY